MMKKRNNTYISLLLIVMFFLELNPKSFAEILHTKLDTIEFPAANVSNANYKVYGGDIFVDALNTGLVLTADNGSCWRVNILGDGTFTTDSIACPAGIIPVDGDGNVYSTVKIGDQIWMGQSLRTTSYRDGTPITKVTNDNQANDNTINTPIASYMQWQFDDSNAPLYGCLYNYLVKDAVLNGGYEVCPTGYKIPSLNDYLELQQFIQPGAPNVNTNMVGSALKRVGNEQISPGSLWLNSNLDATNSSGFDAVPGFYYFPYGFYYPYAYFWLSDTTTNLTDITLNIFLVVNSNTFSVSGTGSNTVTFFSKIRCIAE